MESHLQRQTKSYNTKFVKEEYGANQTDRELDSRGPVKVLLKNVCNERLQSQQAIID